MMMMDERRAFRIIRAYLKRVRDVEAELLDSCFPEQRAFITDPCKRIAALCTRRAGKSHGIGVKLFIEALKHPNSTVLYVGLTRMSAQNTMCQDILSRINDEFMLGADFSVSSLTYTLPNGSKIKLTGGQRSEGSERLRGQKFPFVFIDEAASFPKRELTYLIDSVLTHCVADYDGTIAMTGTPGNIKSLFYDVTSGGAKGWSVHSWSHLRNPHQLENRLTQLKHRLAANPGLEDTPTFKREDLGQWVVDEDALIYHYDAAKNSVAALPSIPGEWKHVLGIDLGYNDDSAISVLAYNVHDPAIYVVDCFKGKGLDLQQFGAIIKEYETKYRPVSMVVDHAKQSVETMRSMFSLPLEPAEKADKQGFIGLFDTALRVAKVKLVSGEGTGKLAAEWADLVKKEDDESGRWIEHPSCPNHLSDATLYAWRECRHYVTEAIPCTHAIGSAEWEEAQEEKLRQRLSDNSINRHFSHHF